MMEFNAPTNDQVSVIKLDETHSDHTVESPVD